MRDAINIEQLIAQLNLQIQELKQAVSVLNRDSGFRRVGFSRHVWSWIDFEKVTESAIQ